MPNIEVIAVTLSVSVAFAAYLFYLWRDVLSFFFIEYLGISGWLVSQQQKEFILSKLSEIDYYNNLSKKGKEFFSNRVIVFMMNRNFFGEGIKISDEIKILVAASAVQLTFRIRRFYIDHIRLIRVFPKAVWSQVATHKVKGLTIGNGVIWLSWEDVKKGFDFPEDGINLGLHEMAHAFKLTIGGEYGSYHHLYRKLKNWEIVSQKKFNRLHNGDESFFRKYGGTNMDEFFAVNVEFFFEKPEEFSLYYPQIYFSLCSLFNQNPLNKKTDYKNDFSTTGF